MAGWAGGVAFLLRLRLGGASPSAPGAGMLGYGQDARVKMSRGVEWALHSCSLLAGLPVGRCLPAAKLAEFYELPSAYLAKTLQALARAGVVEPAYGKGGGYRLAKPPGEITLLDVVQAVEGSGPAFCCGEIRRRGPSGLEDACYPRACTFAAAMWAAEQAWADRLRKVTLADVRKDMTASVPDEQRRRGAAWLIDNARP